MKDTTLLLMLQLHLHALQVILGMRFMMSARHIPLVTKAKSSPASMFLATLVVLTLEEGIQILSRATIKIFLF